MNGCRNLHGILPVVRHVDPVLFVDMGDYLISKRQDSGFVGLLVLVDMDRGDLKSLVPVGRDLFLGDAFVVFLDMYHQHMEMKQFFLLHTITFRKTLLLWLTKYTFLEIFKCSLSAPQERWLGWQLGTFWVRP